MNIIALLLLLAVSGEPVDSAKPDRILTINPVTNNPAIVDISWANSWWWLNDFTCLVGRKDTKHGSVYFTVIRHGKTKDVKILRPEEAVVLFKTDGTAVPDDLKQYLSKVEEY